ncbi:MAG TPA: glycoside hydrolase family 97 protein [Puia sp.]|jgi:alpha-glucosidase|nr:glycoside hydrolase family 97 protein [Puia sp.]
MKGFISAISACCIAISSFAFKGSPLRLLSPDEKILYEFDIRKGVPGYSVSYQGRKLIDFSIINLVFRKDSIIQGVRLIKSIRLDSSEKYILMTGRSGSVNDPFHQISIFLKENKSPGRYLIVEVRIFDDGIAFRYRFPKSNGDSLFIMRELSGFQITGNPKVHTLVFEDYHSSHEGFYEHRFYEDLPKDSLMDMPMLFEYPDSMYLAITEAALLDYAGMYLIKTKSGLVSNLSPLPSKPEYAVVAALPHESPWRVILISKHPGRFLETNMITDLAPPNRINDWTWIKPGKTTFPWWNGNVTTDTLNAPGNNFVTQQYYIDFCARNKIEYHSVVEYGLHQWYQDDGISFMPGPNSNVLKPVPGLDMKQVCDYAHNKGVGVRVWVHWKALYPKLDSAFVLFEQWGLSGLMVDFMDRDDQEMVNIQTEILQKAADHHLHIQFHGAYKPTGLSRTYPNEFTREGTLNYEHDKWNPRGVPPDHDLDIAFTRLIAGSTDYHLGGFHAVTPEKFRAQYTRPLVLGTRSHMLAMYVVLENANAMVCDYPEAYEGQPGFDFIKEVPTTWDETKVLNGEPDQYFVIARRKNNNWWIGGITGNKGRTLLIPFDWLGHGKWNLSIYQDDLKMPFNPNGILIKSVSINITEQVKNNDPELSDVFKIPMAAGGGFTMKLEKE